MPYSLPVTYAPGGINLSLPETLKALQSARDGKNFKLTPSADLIKRKGFQLRSASDVGYGLAIHEKRVETAAVGVDGFGDFIFGLDPFGSATTLGLGTIERQIVGIDDLPKVWTKDTFDITYSGTGSATLSISASDSDSITLILSVDGSAVLTQDLGIGSEGSPTTLSALETAIDAVSDFAATTPSAATSVPASFLDFKDSVALTKDVAYEVGFGYWGTINCPLTQPMPNTIERATQDDFENPTTVSLNGVLYINNGFDAMQKYDGQNLYRAGLPQPSTPSGAVDTGTGVGATFTGVWNYRITYKQIDAVGNTLISRISSDTSDLDNSAGPYAIDVTVNNLSALSGYNTNGGLASSTHSSTNVATGQERINVDDGAAGAHTIKVGDIIYFWDTVSAAYVTKEVLAVTSSTVTIASDAGVGLTNNDPISNNLRIQIWRAEVVAGVDPVLTDYQLVVELPNDPTQSTQSYKDEVVPANIGIEYTDYLKTEGTPPKCKYGIQWRNQMVLAGDPSQPTRLYYSEFADSINVENFPAVNVKEIPQGGGGRVTGLGVLDRNLFIFNEDQVWIAEGNLADDFLQIDSLSDNLGCVSNHTIQVIDGSIYFLSNKGVARIKRAGGGYAVEIVSRSLDPLFKVGAPNDFRSSHQRATAVGWVGDNKYVLFMPSETTAGGYTYADSDSRVYVYDVERGAWLIWDNINAQGGLVEWDDGNSGDVIWFHSREASGNNHLHRFNLTDSEIDYSDHTRTTISGVDFSYWPQWDFQRSPNERKIYTEVALDSFINGSELNYTPSGDITVGVYRDFNPNTELYSFTTSLQSDDAPMVEALSHQVVRSIGFKFSNSTLNKQVLLSGWGMEAMKIGNGIRRP